MGKVCIVCGAHHQRNSKNFCSEKCHQEWYYNQNKDRLLKKHRQWSKDNAEKCKEYREKYRAEDEEKVRTYHREYQRAKKENPEYRAKYNAYQKEYQRKLKMKKENLDNEM